jgi:hypothetical protein
MDGRPAGHYWIGQEVRRPGTALSSIGFVRLGWMMDPDRRVVSTSPEISLMMVRGYHQALMLCPYLPQETTSVLWPQLLASRVAYAIIL